MAHKQRQLRFLIPVLILLLLPLLLWSASVCAAPPTIAIGVLAKRGPTIAFSKWGATAQYLSEHIPQYNFVIVPLDFTTLHQAVEQEKIDFFITNSSYYVELEAQFNVSHIATLENLLDGKSSNLFGGVIFTSIARTDLKTLDDLKGHSFMAVNPRSLGGWQMAWRELKKAGINPHQDFSQLSFGETHDAVVHAVLSEKVEAGTVRTDTLERMLAEGKISANDFRIINQQPQGSGFPFFRSTSLYPEWPFAKLQHTPPELAKLVARALLRMEPDNLAAKNAQIAGWNVPLNYYPIHELMRYLHLGPYHLLGMASLDELIKHRWREGAAILFLITLLLAALFWSWLFNRRIKKIHTSLTSELSRREAAETKLEEHRQHLETLVQRRTNELQQTNLLSHKAHVRLEEAQRVAHLGCWEWQIPGNSLWWSAEIYRIFGLAPAQFAASFEGFLDTVHPADRDLVQRAVEETLANGSDYDIEHRIILPSGEERIVHERGKVQCDHTNKPVRMIGTVQDITHRKQTEDEKKDLEDQLLHLHKIEAIGTLAGGIAHDFNNLLTPILGYAELVEEAVADNEDASRHIAEVITAGNRAAALVQQILTFSRKSDISADFFSPAIMVKESLKLLRSSLPSSIDIQTKIDNDSGLIHADPTKFQQVIVNICTNALHAMENEKGVLTVRLGRRQLGAADLLPNHEMTPGEFIEIIISDTGCGMAEATVQHIFEPYFTTKEPGRGTGLGLAIVHGIIREMHGAVRVTSKVGRGTTFAIHIPAAKQATTEAVPADPQPLPGGNEHILIIDDEKPVLLAEKLILERLGYRVTAKTNSEEALAEFEKNPTAFDLIFTDQTMPGLTGTDLASRILAIRPEMPIILSTGYSSVVNKESAKAMGIKTFLMKPVSRQTMATTVREMLDSKN
ncbi:PhnD/SsuA/transferrin family substrate-binding protein [Thermodesulfobacteriota bacterium]